MSLLLASIVDFFLQDPKTRFHPIALLGQWIKWLEQYFYSLKNKVWGGFLLVCFTLISILLPLGLLEFSLPAGERLILQFLMLFLLLAGGTLADAGKDMQESLELEELKDHRRRLSMLVGRDTAELQREDIIKATVETVAENTIDAFVAPFFFMVVGYFLGSALLGGAFYKIVNTFDSMIAYRNPRYEKFGKFAAKLDDWVNWIPARLGSLLMLLGGISLGLPGKRAWKTMLRDGRNHLSPNAGIPEALVSGFLGIQLGGTHHYKGVEIVKPSLGEEIHPIEIDMIQRTVDILKRTQMLTILIWAVLWGVLR